MSLKSSPIRTLRIERPDSLSQLINLENNVPYTYRDNNPAEPMIRTRHRVSGNTGLLGKIGDSNRTQSPFLSSENSDIIGGRRGRSFSRLALQCETSVAQ
jgi:hypothetical protein